METENNDSYKEISDTLSQITCPQHPDKNLSDLLSKMIDTKLELNNDRLYLDQFEDISLRIKSSLKFRTRKTFKISTRLFIKYKSRKRFIRYSKK